MKRFRTPGAAQRFLAVFSVISPHFRPRRHRLTADDYRTEMADRFATWNDITGSSEAARTSHLDRTRTSQRAIPIAPAKEVTRPDRKMTQGDRHGEATQA